tara:strand:+ start:27 stop:557 length:531 start_codon:yes stop_codon:yes gene_type:complete
MIAMYTMIFFSCNDSSKFSGLQTMKTVDYVDLKKYMGDWYVIANIPTFIEKNATNAIESYRLNQNGIIETTFTFFKNSPDGEKKVYRPKGFVHNKKTNAEWRMQFLWPFKLPFLIIELDKDYSYTVIGYPSRKYVWIMARDSKMKQDRYNKILENLSNIGYDITLIQKIPQDWANK